MKLGRKATGKKYHARRKKRLHERKGRETKTILGEIKKKTLRGKGGNQRTILLKSNVANVKTKSGIKRTEIKNILETPQNRFFARQNRLMKGAIIETPLGKAKITNRPSREGHVNAVLVEG